MALLWFDSFDHYATADILQKWPLSVVGSSTIAAVGRRGTNGLRITAGPNAGNSGVVQKGFNPSGTTAIAGVAVRWVGVNTAFQNPPSESPSVIAFRLNGVTQVWLSLNVTSGLLEAFRGSTSLGVSSVGLGVSNITSIEFLAVIATGTAGSVQARVNGALVMNFPGINTAASGNPGWNQVRLGNITSGGGTFGSTMQLEYDDFYISDGSGPAPWNTFLGDCSAVASYPTAEGALSDWLPLAGTDNSLMVKETPADGDTTYVSTITPGATDVYVTPDLTPGASVFGVQVSLQLRKEDAGSCVVNAVARVGTTNYPVAVPNPGTTYAVASGLFPVNPATGLAWTEAEFNAAQFGFARV